jgi:hypothetical protein
MMAIIYDHPEGYVMQEGDIDGMELLMIEDELNGIEGEHVFDAAVEDPPHPFWDAERMCCRKNPVVDED